MSIKVAVNRCYGGFGLSEKAYEHMIANGIPLQDYVEQKRDSNTGLYLPEPLNEGFVIFRQTESMILLKSYWETWTKNNRSHPTIILAIEALGKEVNGRYANLKIVEIPDDVQ